MTWRRGAALAFAAAAVWTVRPSAAGPRTEDIMSRAATYAADFVQRFTSIVAEERFDQNARRVSVPSGKKRSGNALNARGVAVHRELVSDYLLVKLTDRDEWHAFRDVFQVDGRPVRDRGERLTSLFERPVTGALERALEIEQEGVRYNLGDPTRTLNNPLLALGFVQQQYQPRFKFSVRDADPAAGLNVWIVEYREQSRPTLLRRINPDGDLPARGRLWLDSQTGRLLKSELSVGEDDTVTTAFRFDERFQIALPVEMRETYWNGGEYVEGVARYDRFRQFGVSTEEEIKAIR